MQQGIGRRLIARCPSQPAVALAAEMAVDVAVCLSQCLIGGVGQEVDKRILNDPGLHLAALGIESADMEALALAQAIEQRIVRIAQVHGAAA